MSEEVPATDRQGSGQAAERRRAVRTNRTTNQTAAEAVVDVVEATRAAVERPPTTQILRRTIVNKMAANNAMANKAMANKAKVVRSAGAVVAAEGEVAATTTAASP